MMTQYSPNRLPARLVPRWKFLRAITGKFGVLLLALVALILFSPLVAERQGWVGLAGLLSAAVLVAGLWAARPGGGAVGVGVALALIDFGLGRLTLAADTRSLLALQAVLWLTTLLFVTATIIESIFDSSDVNVGTLEAALCVYLLIGLIGAFAFALVELLVPGSYVLSQGARISWADGANVASFMKIFAFSFSTLSGVGASEVSPASGFAANAASLQAMIGQIYLAVVVARLVGIESSNAMQPARDILKS